MLIHKILATMVVFRTWWDAQCETGIKFCQRIQHEQAYILDDEVVNVSECVDLNA